MRDVNPAKIQEKLSTTPVNTVSCFGQRRLSLTVCEIHKRMRV